MLRRLEALMCVADATASLGDHRDRWIEPADAIMAIGSGGNYALAAARALLAETPLSARDIVEKSLHIAGDICIYTNHHLTIETLDAA